MHVIKNIFLVFVQGAWILLLSPLLAGVINKVKARLQGRKGPRFIQPYYDLIKYFRKETVFSEHASWLTKWTPYIVFSATFVSGLLLPMIGDGFGISGDILLFIYLLGLARFFTSLAALDSGSSFGGMGASREMALNTVIEPAFILAILAVILQTGTTNFTSVLTRLNDLSGPFVTLPYVLALFAMLLVLLGETGRIPIDNLDTHLELTMIHEGMVLEYSGRYYGLMVFSSMVKQFLFISLFIMFFFPLGQLEVTGLITAGVSIVVFSIKIILIGIVIAMIEMMFAKLRLYQVPKLFATSMVFSVLAIVVNLLF